MPRKVADSMLSGENAYFAMEGATEYFMEKHFRLSKTTVTLIKAHLDAADSDPNSPSLLLLELLFKCI